MNNVDSNIDRIFICVWTISLSFETQTKDMLMYACLKKVKYFNSDIKWFSLAHWFREQRLIEWPLVFKQSNISCGHDSVWGESVVTFRYFLFCQISIVQCTFYTFKLLFSSLFRRYTAFRLYIIDYFSKFQSFQSSWHCVLIKEFHKNLRRSDSSIKLTECKFTLKVKYQMLG